MQQTYSEKLQHPKWQKKRNSILQRDEYRCRLCGDDQTQLHVHHKFYQKNAEPWQYEDDSLITLCKYCHWVTEWYKPFDIEPLICVKIPSRWKPSRIKIIAVYKRDHHRATLFGVDTETNELEHFYELDSFEGRIGTLREYLDKLEG